MANNGHILNKNQSLLKKEKCLLVKEVFKMFYFTVIYLHFTAVDPTHEHCLNTCKQ